MGIGAAIRLILINIQGNNPLNIAAARQNLIVSQHHQRIYHITLVCLWMHHMVGQLAGATVAFKALVAGMGTDPQQTL